MTQQDQLASFLDEALDAGPRAALEKEFERDAEALRFVIDQRNIDRALGSLLGSAARRERLKQSILASVAGSSSKQLQAQVLADTSGRAIRLAGADSPALGWLQPIQTWIGDILQFFPSPRVAWFAIASAVLLLAVGTMLLFRPTPEARVVIGEFAAVVGEPTLQLGANQPFLKPKPKAPIHLGDRIETGDADKAEIVFKDGTTLRLSFNTAVEISKLKVAQRDAKPSFLRPPEINLLRGQVWTKVQKLTNAPRYAIRTVAATAVARGTEFGVKLEQPRSGNVSTPTAVLTVKEGAVDFSNSLGSVQATAMTESTASANDAPSEPVRLKTIKSFDLAPGKRLNVERQASVFDLKESLYRMVYPHGWVGLCLRSVQDVTNPAIHQLRIVRVWPASPAANAGLAVGDAITHVNGQPVTNVQDVLRPIFYQRNASVALGVSRDDLPKTVSLITTNNPFMVPIGDMPPDVARAVFDATWPLIDAGCQEVISSNQWQELEQQFRSVLDRYPDAGAVLNNLAVWYDMNGAVSPAPAIHYLKQAIASEPGNALYHSTLGRVLMSIGNFERGAEEAEVAVKLRPDWVLGVVELAKAYMVLARYDEAVAVLERGLESSPSCPDLWAAKALVLLSAQRQNEALTAAMKTVELEPAYAVWHLRLAVVYWARGERDAAEAASRKTIELDPSFADAYDSLAVDLVSRLGSRLPEDPTDAQPEELAIDRWRNRPAEELAIIAEAERLSRRAIQLRPNAASAYVNLGNILLLRGAVEEAEKILGKAIELDPTGQGAVAYYSLAGKFAIWGIRLDDALQFTQRAVELSPEGYIFDALATVHFRRGEWDQAEAAWRKCIELAGPQGDPEAWFHLGKLYERRNRPDAAIAAYQEALRLHPDYPEASRALAKLRQ